MSIKNKATGTPHSVYYIHSQSGIGSCMMSVMIFIYTYVGLSALLVSIDRQCESPDTWNERQNWLHVLLFRNVCFTGVTSKTLCPLRITKTGG